MKHPKIKLPSGREAQLNSGLESSTNNSSASRETPVTKHAWKYREKYVTGRLSIKNSEHIKIQLKTWILKYFILQTMEYLKTIFFLYYCKSSRVLLPKCPNPSLAWFRPASCNYDISSSNWFASLIRAISSGCAVAALTCKDSDNGSISPVHLPSADRETLLTRQERGKAVVPGVCFRPREYLKQQQSSNYYLQGVSKVP